MLFLIILLSVAMVLDCLILTLLVLMQLPKKEAGAGLAFGGAATDALFGAGSGNFLIKATKYDAAVLSLLALAISVMQGRYASRPNSEFQRMLKEQQSKQQVIPAPAPAPAHTPEAPATPAPAAPSTPTATAPPSGN